MSNFLLLKLIFEKSVVSILYNNRFCLVQGQLTEKYFLWKWKIFPAAAMPTAKNSVSMMYPWPMPPALVRRLMIIWKGVLI